jgi:hypothetical protein
MNDFLKKGNIFLAGFLTCLLFCVLYLKNTEKHEIVTTEEDTLSLDNQLAAGESGVSIRMNDGVIEWYDGSKWNAYETAEELKMQDPYYLAQDKLAQFEADVAASYHTQSDEAGDGDETSVSNESKNTVWSPLAGTVASSKSSSNSKNSSTGSSSNSGRTEGNSATTSSGNSGSSGGTGSSTSGSSAGTTTPSGGSNSSTGTTTPSSGSSSSAGTTTPSGGSSSSAGTTTPSSGSSSSAGTTTPSGGSDSSSNETTPSENTGSDSSANSGASSGDGQDNTWTEDYE